MISFCVKFELANYFRELAEKEGCEIKNVCEIKSGEILQYWIICPKEKECIISDYAFQTWIKNPVFQKYYHHSKEFQKIADKYISDREKQ